MLFLSCWLSVPHFDVLELYLWNVLVSLFAFIFKLLSLLSIAFQKIFSSVTFLIVVSLKEKSGNDLSKPRDFAIFWAYHLLLFFGVCLKNSFEWKLKRLHWSHKFLVYRKRGCGLVYQILWEVHYHSSDFIVFVWRKAPCFNHF